MPSESQDTSRYGASFAEVYDNWYPGGDEESLCRFVTTELGDHARDDPGRVLELGVGTGRVALQLDAVGFDVIGLDSSPEMLARLMQKDPDGAITTVCADAGLPASWSAAGVKGRFDCVLAACNVLLNLTEPGAQEACVRGAAESLAPGGVLVVELSAIEIPQPARRQIELSTVETDAVVFIATDSDPVTGVVQGRHIELSEDEPTRIRPWAIKALALVDLDYWCSTAGLKASGRYADWHRTAGQSEDVVTVSVYRRPRQ